MKTTDYYKHGGDIYDIKRRHKKDVIDFSANINPLGLSQTIKNSLKSGLDSLIHYPDPDMYALKNAIAKHFNLDKENILLGNGSTELIYLFFNCFKPSSVTLPVPCFTEYERAAKIVNTNIKFVKLKKKEGFKLHLEEADYSDAIFICNPNNPTGNFIADDRSSIKDLSYNMIVVDEAFMDFVPDEDKYSLIKEAVTRKNIIVLRSFTKFFAVPGLRIGFLVSHKENIEKLQQHQMPWSINSLAQKAGEHLLFDIAYIQKTKELIAKEKAFLFAQLSTIKGLKPYPSEANFIFIKIKSRNLTSTCLKNKLLAKGLLVRNCANFKGLTGHFFRIAVRSHKENVQLIKTLKKIL